jgi:glucose-1-phosphate thymidylyltransferase
MKGLVLAGGKGSRLRPFTYSGAKQLVPIANTPVLHFPVRQLVEAGITDIGIVVGDTEAQIREAMGDGAAFGARFTYIRQSEPAGIAHAVLIAHDFLGASPFVVYLGDNVLMGGIRSFVDGFRAANAGGAVVLKRVDDPRAFRVVEKPADPPGNLAVIGVYAFTPAVHDVIARQSPSARGELEIADAINGLMESGAEVLCSVTDRYWIDTGKMEDMLAANRAVLDTIEGHIDASSAVAETAFTGAVRVGPAASVENCGIAGPVVIGAGTRLRECVVGPYVAIGDGCTFEGVTIENAIVMEQSVLVRCSGVTDSMIGRFARVTGAPAGSRLTLGDHSCFEATP